MTRKGKNRMLGKKATVLIIVIAAVLAASLAYMSRGWISKHVYMDSGEKLAGQLPQELSVKYEEELEYTLNKFWSCYERGIVSQNDLTDVMEKMKRLEKKKDLDNKDIFDFIGYVSRIYTDAMQKHHSRELQNR